MMQYSSYIFLLNWVIPEKIHMPPMDGFLKILLGGGVQGHGNPGKKGEGEVEPTKSFFGNHFQRNVISNF